MSAVNTFIIGLLSLLPHGTRQSGMCHVPASTVSFLNSALADLRHQLQQQGSDLLEITGKPEDVLPLLANDAGTVQIYCEEIAAPEEQDQVTALRASGLKVTTSWQSSLLNPADLAIPLDALPDVFSHFRLMVESKQIKPSAPLSRPADMSPLPEIYPALAKNGVRCKCQRNTVQAIRLPMKIQSPIRLSSMLTAAPLFPIFCRHFPEVPAQPRHISASILIAIWHVTTN
jgi:hypothetical protein